MFWPSFLGTLAACIVFLIAFAVGVYIENKIYEAKVRRWRREKLL